MPSYVKTLWAVVAITVGIGCAETAFGLRESSTFLVKDGLEWAYGAAIYTIAALSYGRSAQTESRAGILVAIILAVGGLQGAYEVLSGLRGPDDDDPLGLTTSSLTSVFGALVVAGLLMRFRRSNDPVVEGSWLAARNDVITSILDVFVLFCLKVVPWKWPQTASDSVGVVLAFWSAYVVARDALREREAE